LPHVDTLAGNLLDCIILAASNLHCTALQALLRVAQNAFALGQASGTAECPFCLAPQAARISHFLRCGAIWVFLAENCPGLGWDFSSPDRWQLLLGSGVTDSSSAGMLTLVWDIVHAGAQAGRLGNVGLTGAMSRLVALSKRPGQQGRFAAALLAPPLPV
jgi:hypothetical protein